MALRKHNPNARRAVTLIAVVIVLPVLLGFMALAVDTGYLFSVNARLRRTADAAALAAASQLPDADDVLAAAQEMGSFNEPAHGMVIAASDVIMGNWDVDTRVFAPLTEPYNAVQLTARRAAANNNAVELFFAKLLGVSKSDLSATAVAYREGAGTGFRFLIDDEMFDTDEPAIEDLAASMGKTSDYILRDNDGDHFIDLPPGAILDLPTGQVGDEALFDVTWEDFPFTNSSDPSMLDFLLYNNSGPSYGIEDEDLDPLLGVEPVSNASLYPDFVNPDHIHVSPVYKSDVSNTTPGVNAKGERRGLVAFKIIDLGVDPPGSYLPHLIIEIVDPDEIDLNALVPLTGESGSGRTMLVK
jgi:hypothetical protein